MTDVNRLVFVSDKMESYIETCEQQYAVLSADITSKIGKLSNDPGCKR